MNSKRTLKQEINNVCYNIGLKIDRKIQAVKTIEFPKRQSNFVFDGIKLNIAKRNPIFILHEIAHFQCATPERRKMPEYGCGSFVVENALNPVISQDELQLEECCIMLLQNLWVKKIFKKIERLKFGVELEEDIMECVVRFKEEIWWLQDNKLIDDNFIPLCN